MILNLDLSTVLPKLTELTSIQILEKIENKAIATPLTPDPIPTTYICQGQGQPPILLLHGFDSSLLEFRRLIPLLAPHYQTWAIDLLGFGFTDRPNSLAITPAAIKTHLYHTWQTLIQQPVILVGVSMGGAAAIDFTLTYPEAVQKLVLINSAGFTKGSQQSNKLLTPLIYGAAEFLRHPKVRDYVSKKAYFDKTFASLDAATCAGLHLNMRNWRQAMVSFTQSGGYTFLRDKIAQISHPTLVLWGENDQILGVQDAEKFKTAIATSQVIWIPQCGHVPHLEQSTITAEHLIQFIRV